MAKCIIYQGLNGRCVTIYEHEVTTQRIEHKPELWTPIAEYEASCFEEKYEKKKEFLRQLAEGKIDEQQFKILNEARR